MQSEFDHILSLHLPFTHEHLQAVPLPRTLLDSCWKVVLDIRGTKSEKNRVPVRLTFCTKFSSDDNILEVEKNHRFVKRCSKQM